MKYQPCDALLSQSWRSRGHVNHFYILIHALRVSDLGCHLGHMYVGCIILLSASLINLQKMLYICFDQGSKLDIQFNPFQVNHVCLKVGLDIISCYLIYT